GRRAGGVSPLRACLCLAQVVPQGAYAPRSPRLSTAIPEHPFGIFLSKNPRRRQLLHRQPRHARHSRRLAALPLMQEVTSVMAANTDTHSDRPGSPGPYEADSGVDKSKVFLPLFLQNQRRLYAYILTLLPNRADADDVLQEASLVMWDKFDERAPPD